MPVYSKFALLPAGVPPQASHSVSLGATRASVVTKFRLTASTPATARSNVAFPPRPVAARPENLIWYVRVAGTAPLTAPPAAFAAASATASGSAAPSSTSNTSSSPTNFVPPSVTTRCGLGEVAVAGTLPAGGLVTTTVTGSGLPSSRLPCRSTMLPV